MTKKQKKCAVCRQRRGRMTSYMLLDATWSAAGLRPDEEAHLECVSVALGRQLTKADFTGAPVNHGILAHQIGDTISIVLNFTDGTTKFVVATLSSLGIWLVPHMTIPRVDRPRNRAWVPK